MILIDPLARPIIAHRGDRAHAPENTLVAFDRALAGGADALEFDVHLTADGHVVVCHDATIDRTTNGVGAIRDLTLAQVNAHDAGARWTQRANADLSNAGRRGRDTPFAGTGIRVPLLSEVLERYPTTPFIVEVKSVHAGQPVVDVLERHDAKGRVIVGSFLHHALQPARTAGFYTAASEPELRALLPAALLRLRRERLPFAAVAIPPTRFGLPVPIGGFVRATERPVHVWTVNDPASARRYWAAGARGIITDDPARMAGIRDQGTGIGNLRAGT